ncbi:MAG: Do family serine endopeptidase [Candidatus Omnitrophica bacterium]|nr:Do family serine endopeptidase [Candidatus Omnitrophota bacterium]
MTRRILTTAIIAGVLLAGILGSRTLSWSGSLAPAAQSSRERAAMAVAAGPSEADTLQEAFIRIAERVGPSVVSISTEQVERVRQFMRGRPFLYGPGMDPFLEEFFRQFEGEAPSTQQRRFGLGSGVIIDPKGLVLTNEHVIADADKITVTLSNGKEYVGEVKGKDRRSDLAVVKIDAKKPLPAAQLADSGAVRAGQWAIALGNPFGLTGRQTGFEPTLTVGVISAVDRQLPLLGDRRGERDYTGLIQTDAAINPGNSGGPLLNLQGEVIGINVAIITGSPGLRGGYDGIGFAIPVNKAKHALGALVSGQDVVYGWMGVEIQPLTEEYASFFGLERSEGAVVSNILPGSPAQQAGLQSGDVITAIQGERISTPGDLVQRVGVMQVGERVRLDVMREGKPLSLEVTVGKRPAEGEIAAGETAAAGWRGLKVAALTEELAQRQELAAGGKGVLVVGVEDGSPAEQAGLRPGDVITEISSRGPGLIRLPVETLADYQRATTQVKGDALVKTGRGYVVIKAGG